MHGLFYLHFEILKMHKLYKNMLSKKNSDINLKKYFFFIYFYSFQAITKWDYFLCYISIILGYMHLTVIGWYYRKPRVTSLWHKVQYYGIWKLVKIASIKYFTTYIMQRISDSSLLNSLFSLNSRFMRVYAIIFVVM